MKKAKVKNDAYSIPLPLINTENTTRPYMQHCKSKVRFTMCNSANQVLVNWCQRTSVGMFFT